MPAVGALPPTVNRPDRYVASIKVDKVIRVFSNIVRASAYAARAAAMLLATPANAGKLDKQFELFLSWFPGEYDNYEQS